VVRALPKSPPDGWVTSKGWYDLLCFNSLSGELQARLVYYGNIPLGSPAEGRCHNPAEVEITTVHDAMPGPRFYCLPCAVQYLTNMYATQVELANEIIAEIVAEESATTDTEVSRDV